MKQRSIARALCAAISIVPVGLIPQLAHAQLVLEEVVVTARKREESLQETPLAVSALSGEALEQLGMTSIADLTKVVPNVDLYTGNGTTGSGNAFIRGVGQRNIGVNYDSGVGIYVDGVYASRADGTILDNVDVQSVQVLRGPQGTLFGKNTTGGAIIYTTNKPNEEYEGSGQIRVGNYDQLDGKLTLNIPLVGDTLLSRFSVFSSTRDGYVKAVSTGFPGQLDGVEFNDVDRSGAQAQLRWVADDDLIFDLNYNYNKTDQAARGQNCQVVDGIEGAGWQAELQDPNIVVPSTGKSIREWCEENQALGIDRTTANSDPNIYEAEVNTLALTADWDISDDINFKSITSWRNTEAGQVDELDAIGIPLLDRTNYGGTGTELRETTAFSQELQISGTAFDDRLEYVFGVFGFTEETDSGATSSPSGPFFNSLGNPNLAFYLNQSTGLTAKNSSASIFSQTDWSFNDNWSMTLGVRYTWEERELQRSFRVPEIASISTTGDGSAFPIDNFYLFPSGPDSFNPNHAFIIADDPNNPGQPDPLADQSLKLDDSEITPMVSVQYTFADVGFIDLGTAYATVSNGFLSGGISDTTDVATREIFEYEPEQVWNYELGLKMDAWDNRLRVNTALFYTDYEDRQLTTVRINPDTGRIAGALINADSSSIAGLEIETTILPVENFQITANITFNEGDIEEYNDERILASAPGPVPAGCDRIPVGQGTVDNCGIDRSDENLPRLPEQIYYLALQYNWESEFGTVIPMISWSYRTNVDNCFDRASCLSGLYEVDQENVSARLTWISNDQNWRVTAYGNNITDERYIIGGTPLVDVTETAGAVYNLPRTYGVELSYDW